MIRTDGRDSSTPEERQPLLESARVCEMIVEANPADTGALETLKEIYTKLGDREKLARVVSALAVLPGVRSSVRVAGTKTEEPSDVPAEPILAPVRAVPPTERRLARLGDRLIAEGLITPEQLAQALAAQKGTRDKLGTILVRLGFLAGGPPPRLSVSPAQRALDHADSARHRSGGAAPGSRAARGKAGRPADQANRQHAHTRHGGSDQRAGPRRRRIHDEPADPARGRVRGRHSQGHRPPLQHAGRERRRHDVGARGAPRPTSRSSRAPRSSSPRPTSSS